MHEMTSQENNAWSILAITGTWCFLALIIVLLRVYTRLTTIRYLGWDDIFAVITMIFGMVIWGCFIGESHSALGKHWQAITPEMMVPYSKWQFAHGMLMVWALHGMKIAFAIFLLRLSNGKIFRRSLFAVMCKSRSGCGINSASIVLTTARLHDYLYDSLLVDSSPKLFPHLGILERQECKMYLSSKLPRSGRDLQQ